MHHRRDRTFTSMWADKNDGIATMRTNFSDFGYAASETAKERPLSVLGPRSQTVVGAVASN
jgi:hypothetical protein